jgi:hypothetical protein
LMQRLHSPECPWKKVSSENASVQMLVSHPPSSDGSNSSTTTTTTNDDDNDNVIPISVEPDGTIHAIPVDKNTADDVIGSNNYDKMKSSTSTSGSTDGTTTTTGTTTDEHPKENAAKPIYMETREWILQQAMLPPKEKKEGEEGGNDNDEIAIHLPKLLVQFPHALDHITSCLHMFDVNELYVEDEDDNLMNDLEQDDDERTTAIRHPPQDEHSYSVPAKEARATME